MQGFFYIFFQDFWLLDFFYNYYTLKINSTLDKYNKKHYLGYPIFSSCVLHRGATLITKAKNLN